MLYDKRKPIRKMVGGSVDFSIDFISILLVKITSEEMMKLELISDPWPL